VQQDVDIKQMQEPQVTQLDFSGSKTLAFSLALLCSLFIIYGSWLPFTLSGADLTQAWQQFLQLWQQESTSFSGVDFGTNILLTIPLAFFAAAWLQQLKPLTLRYPVIVLYCLLLAFVVELGQLMFSGRVASPYDVLAQGIGAVLGLLLWHQAGQIIWPLLSQLTDEVSSGSVWYRLAVLYAVVFFVYNVLPLDLTLNPEGIYDKWKAGKILLLPFQYKDGPWFEISYAVISDVAVWLPLAYFVLRASKTRQPAVLYVGLYSVFTEVVQLFVMSRTTDIGDVIYALLAVLLLKIFKVKRQEHHTQSQSGTRPQIAATLAYSQISSSEHKSQNLVMSHSLPALLLFWVFWTVVLLLLFWYPFDFSTSHVKAKVTFDQWFTLPFIELFRDSVLSAVTTMLQKCVLFAPLGWLLARLRLQLSTFWLALVALLVTAQLVLIEVGQIFLVGKVSNLTDVLIGIIAVVSAFIISRQFEPADKTSHPSAISVDKGADRSADESAAVTEQVVCTNNATITKPAVGELQLYLSAVIKFVLTVIAFVYLSEQNFVPYNLREFLGQGSLVQSVLVAGALFFCFSFWSIWFSQRPKTRPILLLLLLFLHSQVFFWWLYLTVPLEVLQDFVGASHWQSLQALDMALRFSALLLIVQLPLLLNAMLSFGAKRTLLPLWIILLPFAFLLWHLVVVVFAITDNITELMAEGGGWLSSILLWLWLQGVFLCSHWLGSLVRDFQPKMVFIRLLLISVFVYTSFALISLALEASIYKYGNTFSALQFLLSPDRDNYVPTQQLAVSYYLAVCAFIFALSWFSRIDEKK